MTLWVSAATLWVSAATLWVSVVTLWVLVLQHCAVDYFAVVGCERAASCQHCHVTVLLVAIISYCHLLGKSHGHCI